MSAGVQMFLEMGGVPGKISTPLHALVNLVPASFSLLWNSRMHLDVFVEVTLVVTFVVTLATMMHWFMPPLLSKYRLRVDTEESDVGVDDDSPPLIVLPLVSVLGPDRLEDLRALVTLVLASMESLVLLKSLLARKLLATIGTRKRPSHAPSCSRRGESCSHTRHTLGLGLLSKLCNVLHNSLME